MSRPARLLGLALVVLSFNVFARAQRLPTGVHPDHYNLSLTPDLAAATFSGTESIDVTLEASASSITLNAAEITFSRVQARSGNEDPVAAEVSLDSTKEQATFTFPRPLPAGKLTLLIDYTGILNSKLRGFYLSKTRARNYAVTQFEATDARRAFPSFDEPALKATFDISLTVDAADSVISNTNQVSDKPASPGKHTLTFATTPRMSTYLVAFLVGDFQCTSSNSDGVPIRACATPDKVALTGTALESAKHFLHYYDTYFGIKYPMPKLDMVALPDFEAGAMENFGCITYRETDLLVDAKSAPLSSRKRVASVVAHEMAHQWFGDMVTMQWWDNLWLNEGFATWMQAKAVADWRPDWKFDQDVAVGLDTTLNYDSQPTTRTIRARASTPDEINEMFDGIAYGKAGAVLGMVEHYLGEEVFRQGVHNYLQSHLYANATAEDFWTAQTERSHQPVDRIMEGFITAPGVPLLTFSQRTSAGVPVTQRRFFLAAEKNTSSGPSWTVPVCIKTRAAPICRVLTPSDNVLPLPADASLPFFYANADSKGYYRVAYSPEQLSAIISHAETGLSPTERINLIGDRWALTRAGQGSVGDFLSLAIALKGDPNAAVVETALGKIGSIEFRIASDADRQRLNAVLARQLGPVYRDLGKPSKSDSVDRQQLRAAFFSVLGEAKDETVLREARSMAERIYPASGDTDKTLDPALARSAVEIAATNGDPGLYDRMLAASKNSRDPDLQTEALYGLASFRDPALVGRTLDYVVSGQVRNQDSWVLIAILLQQRETQEQAWRYVRENWARVKAQLTASSGARVVGATAAFCSAERRSEAATFFAAHPVAGSERTLAKSLDSIDDCIHLRAAQQPRLERWLADQH